MRVMQGYAAGHARAAWVAFARQGRRYRIFLMSWCRRAM